MSRKDDVARLLARQHFELETGLTHIFRLTTSADVELRETETIKLLEVNEADADFDMFQTMDDRGNRAEFS